MFVNLRHSPVVLLLALAFPAGTAAQGGFFTYSQRARAAAGSRIDALAFSPDGRLAAIGTASGQVGILPLMPSGALQWVARLPEAVDALAFSVDSRRLAAGGAAGHVSLIEIEAGASSERRLHRRRVSALAFSPDGEWLVSGADDGEILVSASDSLSELFRLRSPDQRSVRAVSFSDAGRRLAAATSGGKICEWDVLNRALVRQLQDSDKVVASASFGARGALLALGAQEKNIHRGALSGPVARTGVRPTGRADLEYGELSPAVRLSDLVEENRLRLYDLRQGEVKKTLEGIRGELTRLSLAPDGRYIAAIRRTDRADFLSVFDLRGGVETVSVPVEAGLRAVAFSPTGAWLGAATGQDELLVFAVSGVQPDLSAEEIGEPGVHITSSREPLIAAGNRAVVAVMDLEPLGVEVETSRAVSDMLRNRIAASRAVTLVERQRMQQVMKELAFQYSDRADPLTAVQLGRLLSARKMIIGSLSRLGSVYSVSVQIVDVETARIDGIREVVCRRCTVEDLPAAVAALGASLAGEGR